MNGLLWIDDLPANAIEAAAVFYRDWIEELNAIASEQASDCIVILPNAPYDHRDWRRAAARDLARRFAPVRVNVVAGVEGSALQTTLSYLANAPGVTGQYMSVSAAHE